MVIQWMKVGTDVVVGGAAGAVDQLIQKEDDKRIAATPDLGIMSRYGTYYNYGIPILAILGTAMGWLKGDWATRAVVAGSQLAGRKVTKRIIKDEAVPFTNFSRQRQLEEARARALAAARGRGARGQVGGEYTPPGIPVIADAAILV